MYKLPYTGAEIESLLKGASNKNLLHNWDFRNPVNQRGASSYSVNGYGIDRFRTNSPELSVIIASGYTTLTNTGASNRVLTQIFESMQPGVYTLSVMLSDNSIYSTTVTVTGTIASGQVGSGTPSTTVTPGLALQIGEFNLKPSLKINVGAGYSFNIVAVKLELGSVSTLANDPPADYGEQLALCQRYCLAVLPFMFLRASTSYAPGYIDFHIPVPVSMRTTPSISVNGISLYNMSGTIQSGFAFSVPVHTSNGLLLRATKSAHGLTDAYMLTGSLTVFSADL